MREIPLNNGYTALVDDEDFAYLSQFKWYAHRHHRTSLIYAVRNAPREGKSVRRTILMHREVLQPRPGHETDHINNNGLDNRRDNLRYATRSQNTSHPAVTKRRGLTSSYRGVFWHARRQRWHAQISVNNRRRHLGTFRSERVAALVYDNAAIAAFGEFASLNFPRPKAAVG